MPPYAECDMCDSEVMSNSLKFFHSDKWLQEAGGDDGKVPIWAGGFANGVWMCSYCYALPISSYTDYNTARLFNVLEKRILEGTHAD